jgi:FtsH-binding integral membrane protein
MVKPVINLEYSAKSAEARAKSVSGEGLKAYIRKVFNYMGISLGITALLSYVMIRTELFYSMLSVENGVVTGYSPLGLVVMFAPLAIVLFMRFFQNMSAGGAKAALFAVAALEGSSISVILALFAGVSTAFQAFLITGIIFGTMSLYGYVTDTDLTRMGNILIMGVWGLFIVSLVSFFTGPLGIWFSYLTVIIFTGLIAYEVQMIKHVYAALGGKGEESDKIAAFCALNLYLSFLNIFLALLRILGNDRR